MKNYSVLIFLLCGYVKCSKYSEHTETVNMDKDDEYIIRPCSNQDINCIRRFFGQHAYCNVSHGPVPDPLHLKRIILPLAYTNATLVLNDVEVKGLNGKITEFYINKKTDNLIIAVEIINLNVYSPNTNLRYHRKAKEPIVLTDATMIIYKSVTFTATIPNLKKLQLSKSEVYGYLEDTSPIYAVGPGLVKSADPIVLASFSTFISNVTQNVKEALVFQGPMFMDTYIKYNICDFGLKAISYKV